MKHYFQEDTIDIDCRRYRVRFACDDDHGLPWEDDDGRGIVLDWRSREGKKPGWRVLNIDGGSARYFDWGGTMKKAKQDGWGLGEEELAKLTADLGAAPTPGQIAERATQMEFDFLRAYCNDDWSYVGIEVVAIIDGEPDESLEETCWGFETWKDYHLEAAQMLARDLDSWVVAELAARAATEERNATIRDLARAQVGAHEVYDDASVVEVDDGYWVTAKIFVSKE